MPSYSIQEWEACLFLKICPLRFCIYQFPEGIVDIELTSPVGFSSNTSVRLGKALLAWVSIIKIHLEVMGFAFQVIEVAAWMFGYFYSTSKIYTTHHDLLPIPIVSLISLAD